MNPPMASLVPPAPTGNEQLVGQIMTMCIDEQKTQEEVPLTAFEDRSPTDTRLTGAERHSLSSLDDRHAISLSMAVDMKGQEACFKFCDHWNLLAADGKVPVADPDVQSSLVTTPPSSTGLVAETTIPFPSKLMNLLLDERNNEVVSFIPSGDAFMIYDSDKFVSDIAPRYFRHTKLSSFKRQLNLYGFRMISKGQYKGAYRHDLFHRDFPEQCLEIKRTKKSEHVSINIEASSLQTDRKPPPLHNITFSHTTPPTMNCAPVPLVTNSSPVARLDQNTPSCDSKVFSPLVPTNLGVYLEEPNMERERNSFDSNPLNQSRELEPCLCQVMLPRQVATTYEARGASIPNQVQAISSPPVASIPTLLSTAVVPANNNPGDNGFSEPQAVGLLGPPLVNAVPYVPKDPPETVKKKRPKSTSGPKKKKQKPSDCIAKEDLDGNIHIVMGPGNENPATRAWIELANANSHVFNQKDREAKAGEIVDALKNRTPSIVFIDVGNFEDESRESHATKGGTSRFQFFFPMTRENAIKHTMKLFDRIYVDFDEELDVACGRGKMNDSRGNVWWRRAAEGRRLEYKALGKKQCPAKRAIIEQVVRAVRKRGGKFVSDENSVLGMYYLISDSDARKITSAVLRG